MTANTVVNACSSPAAACEFKCDPGYQAGNGSCGASLSMCRDIAAEFSRL